MRKAVIDDTGLTGTPTVSGTLTSGTAARPGAAVRFLVSDGVAVELDVAVVAVDELEGVVAAVVESLAACNFVPSVMPPVLRTTPLEAL